MESAPSAPLVKAAQAGDRDAFEALYQRYAAMVHAIAVAHAPFDRAPDIVQEAFLRALRRLRTLRDPDAFGGWIAAIARNVARDMIGDLAQAGELVGEPAGRSDQEEQFDAQAALRAIQSLPAAYRETLMMRLVHGMTGPEIAARTGLSPGSVRVNLHRGMTMLRDRLEKTAATKRT